MTAAREKLFETLEFDAVRRRLLRYCSSLLGKSVVTRLQPFETLEKARRAVDQVTEMRAFLEGEGRCVFRGTCDAVAILEKALEKSKSIEPKDLHGIATLLECGRLLRTALWEPTEDKPELRSLISKLEDLEDIEGELKRTVDAGGRVLSTASPRLAAIRIKMEALIEEIRKRAESFLANKEVARHLQEAHITFRNGRMVLPVRVECRRKVPGILHDYSASGNTVFIEPEALVEKHNALEKKRLQETRAVTKVLWERTRRLIDSLEEIRTNQRILSWLDFTMARARYAMEYGFEAPDLAEGGRLDLRKARHPLLLAMAFDAAPGDPAEKRCAAERVVVPMDLHLGDRFDVLVITGPNTGGKTVALKSAGLLALMAAAGLHVPAGKDARIPFFRSVLADIGDEQDITRSLSTFSSHMGRISEILDKADEHSLVLIDELGTGTDPLEGEALGRAILRFLVRTGARVLVSTHLSKLKEFAFSSPRVENACMEFDPDTLSPTYHLRIGVPGESNAIRIARRLGIPEGILKDAEESLEGQDYGLKELMDQVQRIRLEDEKTLKRSRSDAAAMEKLKEEARVHEQELAFRKSVLEQEAEREIDQILSRSREEAQALLRKLQNLPVPYRDPVESLRQVLDKMLERSPLGQKRRRFAEGLKKGDEVYIPRYREKCRVIKVYRKEQRVLVAYKNLSVEVPFDEVMWPHWF